MKTTFCNYISKRCYQDLPMLPQYTISIPMLIEGLEKHIIQIFQPDDLIAARIGEHWFYICSEQTDDLTQWILTHKNKLPFIIYQALNTEPILGTTSEDSTEWLYYAAYLIEHDIFY